MSLTSASVKVACFKMARAVRVIPARTDVVTHHRTLENVNACLGNSWASVIQKAQRHHRYMNGAPVYVDEVVIHPEGTPSTPAPPKVNGDASMN